MLINDRNGCFCSKYRRNYLDYGLFILLLSYSKLYYVLYSNINLEKYNF